MERLGTGFVKTGLEPGDRIALLSENRLEWALTDYAAMSAGLILVPIHAVLPPDQIAYILRDSEARAIVVSTLAYARKVEAACRAVSAPIRTICIEPKATEVIEDAQLLQRMELDAADAENAHKEFLARRTAVQSDDVMTLIYTSGTTGNPKGVMLTHRNFVSNVQSGLQIFDVSEQDVLLTFIPLSHVFERTGAHYLPMFAGATIAYSRSIRRLGTELQEVGPTFMTAPPRFYENLHDRILKDVNSGSWAKRRLFDWATVQGLERSRRVQKGGAAGIALRAKYAIADRFVFRRLRARVGGRLRFFVSGGAPLAISTAEFFHGAGILILEGYGMTEASPIIAANCEAAFRFGTVGRGVPGVEVRIADDGEILTRGPHVMKGYYKLEEETRRTISDDGWLYTGDLGELDEDGFLRITGRKKNLFKLSSGEYVAPEPIENALKASIYIQESVVFGESQRLAGALIVPSFAALEAFANDNGIPCEPHSTLVQNPLVQQLYRKELDRLTAPFAEQEKIRVFLLLDREFTIEAGELTPTEKVKRSPVLETYAEQIASLYVRGDSGTTSGG